MKYVAIWIFYKKFDSPTLLKIILFLHLQIDQTKAETPMCILSFVFFNTIQPILKHILILVWGAMLYGKWRMRQRTFAKGHERNRCSIVSSESQKQHFLHLFHYLFKKLSLVRSTFLLRNHIKVLISFHGYVEGKRLCPFIKSPYTHFTKKRTKCSKWPYKLKRFIS
jgi:hypothetical protein